MLTDLPTADGTELPASPARRLPGILGGCWPRASLSIGATIVERCSSASSDLVRVRARVRVRVNY